MNSVRDELKDKFRSVLANHFKIDILEVDSDLVGCLADVAFDFFDVDVKKQDSPFHDTIELTLKDYILGGRL